MRCLLLLFCLVWLGACSPERKGQMPDNDYESSTFRRAKEKYELRDYREAISLYEEVLRDNPEMAKAHFALGLIYNDKIGDPVSAIYHFRKFLRLRPNSDKAKTVKEWITRAELSIASLQPNSPMESTEQFVEIQKENLALKNANEKLQQELTWLKHRSNEKTKSSTEAIADEKKNISNATVTSTSNETAVESVTNAITLRLVTNNTSAGITPTNAVMAASIHSKKHTVQAGETLWRIAVHYYPEQVKAGAAKIMEANHLSDPSKLKSGQILIIP